MDRLTGPSVVLYSVAWHPFRPFIAVATSDGLVDMWGPRMDWTNFAPDFQTLPMNVEYVEREDELDKDATGKYLVTKRDLTPVIENSTVAFIDVISVDSVSLFASDSEDEAEMFSFETKIKHPFMGRTSVKMTQLDD